MAVFSTNQNRHLFVVKTFKSYIDTQDGNKLKQSNLTNVGDLQLHVLKNDNCFPEFYFTYMGPNKRPIKSELIQVKNINYIKGIAHWKLRTPYKKIKVALDPTINSGNPVAGQDYILRIELRQFYGMSDEDQYFKDAVVHVTAGMTAEAFYGKMKESLDLCFSREVGATKTANPYLAFSSDSTGITITEKPQEYIRGTASKERVLFDVFPTTIYVGGDDVVWAKKTNGKYYEDISYGNGVGETQGNMDVEGDDATGFGNGAAIADLEYFCLGERGDQYRMIGWPNIVPTEYQVDPNKEYNVLEFHFGFTDTGVNSYRSEKDITIVVEYDYHPDDPDPENEGQTLPAYDAGKREINGIINTLNTIFNLGIATVV